MTFLRQATAATLKVGPFVDETDGHTPETALSIAQADVRLSKAAGDFAQKAETSALVHDESGIYDCDLDEDDTDTVGPLKVLVAKSGARLVVQDYYVLSAEVFDQLFGAEAPGAPTASAIGAGVLDLTNGIESGLTLRQALRLIVAAAAGKISGAGTGSITIRDVADSKNRIVASTDVSGNRLSVTRDLT